MEKIFLLLGRMVFLLLGVLCLVYGILVMRIGSGTRFFMVWLGMGLFFILLGILTNRTVWMMVPFYGKLIIGLLFACLLIWFLFTEIRICDGFDEDGETGLDYIIVPGAQIYRDGPSVVLRYRLDKACEYLEENPDTVCIVSGAKGYNEPYSEAEGMKKYMVTQGIPETRILEERQAGNTTENIRNSMKMFDPKKDRIGIITNNFHLYRSVGIAKKAGIQHVCGIAAGSTPLYLPNNMLRECMGVTKDRLKGNL